VPVFNEDAAIHVFYKEVMRQLDAYELEIIFIDDGSTDQTELVALGLSAQDSRIKVLSFTRNFGKEAALMAGLQHSTGDVVIPLDVDLQDPIEVIPMLIERWQNGADVVLAKRSDRTADGWLKRSSAAWFYRFHNMISKTKIEENVGDFRLMSRKTVDDVKRLGESNLFMKGVLSWVGGRTEIVEYVRPERSVGESKFNGWKLWNLALEGITSFSTFPLRVWTYIGFTIALLSFLYGGWMIVDKIFWGNAVPGYPSLLVSILFLGGIQLIGIGVLGEYIGRVYMETKKRPRYLLKERK
jgi:glycosyltransferase involved in cell wall biosynthesis